MVDALPQIEEVNKALKESQKPIEPNQQEKRNRFEQNRKEFLDDFKDATDTLVVKIVEVLSNQIRSLMTSGVSPINGQYFVKVNLNYSLGKIPKLGGRGRFNWKAVYHGFNDTLTSRSIFQTLQIDSPFIQVRKILESKGYSLYYISKQEKSHAIILKATWPSH